MSPILLFQKGRLANVNTELETTAEELELLLEPGITKSDYKLILNTGYTSSLPKDYEIGELQFEKEGLWKLFAKKDGTPIGIGTRIYQFIGEPQFIENELEIEYRNVCKGD